MPARNTIKLYDAPAFYHVYNRGIDKRKIFMDDQDYAVFLNIMKRHLDVTPSFDSFGREYDRFEDTLELTAFCLMPNHFHLLIFQDDPEAMTKFMRKIATAYSVYFNNKYKRSGRLFQGPYRASRITTDSYLIHITRYIHLNPQDYLVWQWSSLDAFLRKRSISWLHFDRTLTMSSGSYLSFLQDHEDYKSNLKLIRYELADS